MKATLYITDDAKEAMSKVPRSIPYSALFRWAVTFFVLSMKDYEKQLTKDAKLKEVDDYLSAKIRERWGKHK
jgi:hypothetical protein